MKRLIGNSVYWLLRLLGCGFKRIPYPLTLVFGVFFGGMVCLCAPTRIVVALDNLKLVFPKTTLGWRVKTFALSMVSFGLNIWEWLWLPAMSQKELEARCEIHNLPLMGLLQKHGGLVLTAHMGNWECSAMLVSYQFAPASIVARYLHPDWLDHVWNRIRKEKAVEPIPETRNLFQIIRRLRQKHVVGIMLDQHLGGSGAVSIPFFGYEVGTMSFLAALQMRTHHYVYPIVNFRNWKTGKFEIVPDGKIAPEKYRLEDYQQQIHHQTRKYQAYIEKWIRQRPDQWFWVHKRFKMSYDYRRRKIKTG